jgi:hypothetical protein
MERERRREWSSTELGGETGKLSLRRRMRGSRVGPPSARDTERNRWEEHNRVFPFIPTLSVRQNTCNRVSSVPYADGRTYFDPCAIYREPHCIALHYMASHGMASHGHSVCTGR